MRKHQNRSGKAPIKSAQSAQSAQSASKNKTQAAALSRNSKHKHTSLKRRAAARQHLTPTRQHNVARNEGVVSSPGRQPSLNSPVQKRQLEVATANTKYKAQKRQRQRPNKQRERKSARNESAGTQAQEHKITSSSSRVQAQKRKLKGARAHKL